MESTVRRTKGREIKETAGLLKKSLKSFMITNHLKEKCLLKICGVVSPYLAVVLGVFYFKNGFLSVLAYHLVLLTCIIGINKSGAVKLILSGFHWQIGSIISGAAFS